MTEKLLERLANLLSVKSLITLSITFVVVVSALKGALDVKDIYLIIIGFYFGTQAKKD